MSGSKKNGTKSNDYEPLLDRAIGFDVHDISNPATDQLCASSLQRWSYLYVLRYVLKLIIPRFLNAREKAYCMRCKLVAHCDRVRSHVRECQIEDLRSDPS
jgi:hypothetical protein